MELQEIAGLLHKKYKDHRDFYPLAALVSEGFVEDSYVSFNEKPSATTLLSSKVQLLAWKFYAMSTADESATYKGTIWSTTSIANPLKNQRLALTGAGYLHLEAYRIRRNERLFAILLAVASAIIAAWLTSFFSTSVTGT